MGCRGHGPWPLLSFPGLLGSRTSNPKFKVEDQKRSQRIYGGMGEDVQEQARHVKQAQAIEFAHKGC